MAREWEKSWLMALERHLLLYAFSWHSVRFFLLSFQKLLVCTKNKNILVCWTFSPLWTGMTSSDDVIIGKSNSIRFWMITYAEKLLNKSFGFFLVILISKQMVGVILFLYYIRDSKQESVKFLCRFSTLVLKRNVRHRVYARTLESNCAEENKKKMPLCAFFVCESSPARQENNGCCFVAVLWHFWTCDSCKNPTHPI